MYITYIANWTLRTLKETICLSFSCLSSHTFQRSWGIGRKAGKLHVPLGFILLGAWPLMPEPSSLPKLHVSLLASTVL